VKRSALTATVLILAAGAILSAGFYQLRALDAGLRMPDLRTPMDRVECSFTAYRLMYGRWPRSYKELAGVLDDEGKNTPLLKLGGTISWRLLDSDKASGRYRLVFPDGSISLVTISTAVPDADQCEEWLTPPGLGGASPKSGRGP